DLVLGLERAYLEVLVARELLEDRARRRDRVGAEEERQSRKPRRGDEPERQRLVAGDVPVRPGLERRRLHLVRDGERLGRLAERVAGAERLDVGRRYLRPLRAELLLEELDRRLDRAPVEPRHQPEREHVLRALGLARRDALDLLQCSDGQRRERHGVHLVLVERAVLERALRIAGLLEVPLGEGVSVYDQRAALLQVGDV